MPNLAANLTLLFTEMPFLDRFAAARAAGFDAVECQFPYDHEITEIRRRLDDNGLRLVLINLPAGDWQAGERGLACDPRRHRDFRNSVYRALDYASALGVPQLHCLAGLVPSGMDLRRARETYLFNVEYAANLCGPRDIRLLIEPINTVDMPGYFLSRTEQALDIIAACDSSNVFLQSDIYHMHTMGEDVPAMLRRALPHIGHVQVADAPGRHEPGTGAIDFAGVFALLDELGYQGWIGCEYQPLADTLTGLQWRSGVAAAVEPAVTCLDPAA
ncbi:hydroxypyruvate isomerase [Pseudoduganella umbonata]|uniref:Hydroxypyruvate isomerase n=1 Tax=Pseudoduganella umbonata TaxID=864828 RepID=A0A4P8HVK0_9BURK|nr:hydroxypyruvate isomerase [Pseudoduganella umbonata]MBB3224037.1 hydroxypyruvate isomerase [Pseudoduganella umbonata]QCP14089.1 hydroxypyruvate isomerase [Pseudoduganella umbonata]